MVQTWKIYENMQIKINEIQKYFHNFCCDNSWSKCIIEAYKYDNYRLSRRIHSWGSLTFNKMDIVVVEYLGFVLGMEDR